MSPSVLWFSLLTVFFWGAGAFFDKLCVNHLPARAVFFSRMYLLFILILTPMVMEWDGTKAAVIKSDRRVIFYIAGSVLATVAGVATYYQAMAKGRASIVVPFCSVYPLVAVAMALMFLKEPLTFVKFLGALMVVGGTMVLSIP